MSQVICPEPGSQLTVGSVTFGPAYVPVLERNHNPTAHDEMMRLLDECARLGKENAALRQLAIAIEADTTEPKHRREWARELLTPNAELRGCRRQSRLSELLCLTQPERKNG